MNQQVIVHSYEHTLSYDTFLTRFRKNLIKEFVSILISIREILSVFLVSIVGVILFVFEFSLFKKVLSVVLPPVAIFLIGKYLTLLPMYAVIPLTVASIFFPSKFFMLIIGLAILISFFIVLLV